jgi:2-polyprenyl-3-methyl-5-hydroxy-6-metoxy-1,4-benzoquinol methylase
VKENDIRPENLMADNLSCIEEDRAFLLARKDRWVGVPCPACGADDAAPYGEKDGFGYVLCAACGTVYTSPRPDVRTLHAMYAQSKNYAYWNKHIFPASDAARKERIYAPRAVMLLEHARACGLEGGTFLEVGAGFGSFCEVVRETGFFGRVLAVEPVHELAETCRGKGLETLNMPVEHVEGTGFADVVASFEVIEHLFDPSVFLHKAHSLLRAGGMLVLSCPNYKGFDMQVMGLASKSFDHEHVNYFHPVSLARLLHRTGFDVRTVFTPGRLDASIVRDAVEQGEADVSGSPLLEYVFGDGWEQTGDDFQAFISRYGMSSHMVAVATRRG